MLHTVVFASWPGAMVDRNTAVLLGGIRKAWNYFRI